MNIHEYQAKKLLQTYSVNVTRGHMADSSSEAVQKAKELGGENWVVKAQIHAGGRGKAGGVKFASSLDEVAKIASEMLGKVLVTNQTGSAGKRVNKLYIQVPVDIVKEYYLGIALDRRLEMQYGFLCGSDETVLVGSSSVLIDEEGEIICLKSAVTGPGEIKKRMSLYNCIDHSTIMFRKDIPAGYREKFRYSQDYDLYLNLISRGCRIDNLPDALVRERMISGSITYSRKDEQEYYRKKAKEFFVQRQKYGMDDYDPMEECRGQEEEYAYGRSKGGFINRQKIYYLLYAGRSEKARRMIRKELSARLDPKLILYFAMSFFPLLLKKMGASRGIRYMPERDG